MSKEGSAIAEGIEILRRMWNHRKFTLKVRNKQLINIDHTIPGLVQDTIDAIWGTRERDLRPLIIKKHQ